MCRCLCVTFPTQLVPGQGEISPFLALVHGHGVGDRQLHLSSGHPFFEKLVLMRCIGRLTEPRSRQCCSSVKRSAVWTLALARRDVGAVREECLVWRAPTAPRIGGHESRLSLAPEPRSCGRPSAKRSTPATLQFGLLLVWRLTPCECWVWVPVNRQIRAVFAIETPEAVSAQAVP